MAPKTSVKIACFATSDANWQRLASDYLNMANTILEAYDMVIDSAPSATAPRSLGFTGLVVDSAGDPGKVVKEARASGIVGNRAVVIYATMPGHFAETYTPTSTTMDINDGYTGPSYIVVNTSLKSATNEVLLHELVHMAYHLQKGPIAVADHDKNDPNSAFGEYGKEYVTGPLQERYLPRKHAEVLRAATFTGPNSAGTGVTQTEQLRGRWRVKLKPWTWYYDFDDKGHVSWLDPLNGETGKGTWTIKGGTLNLSWAPASSTRETWKLPIDPGGETGKCTMDGKLHDVVAEKIG